VKFLCDNCKAKYQIADEKVAGKTVRMKCRKCGHQIEVRASITDSSVSSPPPDGQEARGLATSLSATKPRPAAATGHGQHAQPSGGALAGAFQRTVQDAPNSIYPGAPEPDAAVEMSVADEWYVAINGVPVGPVRISELRRKAATGAVTEDSLVWQEGLEEWRPVKSLPELAALVREAAQGNRPSLLAPPPPEPMRPAPPAPPKAPPVRPAAPMASPMSPMQPMAPMAPPRAPEPARISEPSRQAPAPPSGRSNVVPLHAPRVAASASDDLLGGGTAALAPVARAANAPAAMVAVADPFAPPPAPLAPVLAPPPQTFGLPEQRAPMATAAPAQALGSGVSVVPFSPSGLGSPMSAATPSFAPAAPAAPAATTTPSRRGAPLWFWPVLGFALVFGGVAAVFVFKQQTPPAPVVIQVPAATATATTKADDVPPPTAAPTDSAPAAASSTPAPTKTTVAANGGTKPAPATTSSSKAADLSNLLGGTGSGPTTGPGGAGGTGPAGGTIDAATVQRIVRDRSPGVKRTCWDRGGDQKSSAKVTVAITVGPNGHVDNAAATGDDPVITKCIEGQVRTWQFPATGSTTTVNVPFVFVRQ
jgi:predicted Zn finger-like uncharacterized protein